MPASSGREGIFMKYKAIEKIPFLAELKEGAVVNTAKCIDEGDQAILIIDISKDAEPLMRIVTSNKEYAAYKYSDNDAKWLSSSDLYMPGGWSHRSFSSVLSYWNIGKLSAMSKESGDEIKRFSEETGLMMYFPEVSKPNDWTVVVSYFQSLISSEKSAGRLRKRLQKCTDVMDKVKAEPNGFDKWLESLAEGIISEPFRKQKEVRVFCLGCHEWMEYSRGEIRIGSTVKCKCCGKKKKVYDKDKTLIRDEPVCLIQKYDEDSYIERFYETSMRLEHTSDGYKIVVGRYEYLRSIWTLDYIRSGLIATKYYRKSDHGRFYWDNRNENYGYGITIVNKKSLVYPKNLRRILPEKEAAILCKAA